MKQQLPIKFLIRQSGKLLLYFILASMVISTVYESDLRMVVLRFIPLSVLFFLVFSTNIVVLNFFARLKQPGVKNGRKTFVVGWLCTWIYISIFHYLQLYLQNRGLYPEISNPAIAERTRGWRILLYFPYVSLILYTFVFLIQNFILHQYEKNRIEMELLQLKAVNTETAHQLLQQQIQPHFLFNALNILKSLIRKYPQTAEAYLIRLSDFLRVSLTKNPSGVASLADEIKLCQDYMEMQKIRFGEALDFRINLTEEAIHQPKKLPFFALQPLLENAIKHNELTVENPLHILIEESEDYIFVRNNLQRKKVMVTSTGYGLSNLKERYRLLSGDQLVIEEGENQFSVGLKLLHDENFNH